MKGIAVLSHCFILKVMLSRLSSADRSHLGSKKSLTYLFVWTIIDRYSGCCNLSALQLQKQAEECAEKAAQQAKMPNKGLNVSKRQSEQRDRQEEDPDESSSHGLQTQEGELEADDMEYEGSHETTTSNSDDEDEDSPKGAAGGKGHVPTDNLNRVSVDSSQATVSLTVVMTHITLTIGCSLLPATRSLLSRERSSWQSILPAL